MTERIYSNTVLEVTDDKGLIHLLINLKHLMTVLEPGFPYLNTPHSMKFIFCETSVIYSQQNTEATTYYSL